MKRILAFLLMICLLTSVAAVSLAETDMDQIDKSVSSIFKKYKVTGGTLLVARHGETVYSKNYGYAYTIRKKEPVTDETYFKIASVTKLVSGIHVMQLVEQGKLELDRDISDYLGYKVVNFHYPKVPITLRTLMSHTSSLSTKGGYSRESNKLGELIAKSAGKKGSFNKREPGSAYEYSNFGAGIMGSLIEIVTEKNVNDSIRETLFEPLGIDASYAPALLKEPEKISSTFNTSGQSKLSRSRYLKNPWDPSVNPEKHYRITVGDLWIRGGDLLRLGIMLCNEGELEGKQVLQPETVREMMSNQNGKGVVTCDSPYGLCINRVDNLLKNKMIYGHQGMTNYVICNMYFDPESEFVFVLLTNGANNNMSDHIGIISRKMFDVAWKNFGPDAD